jgi:hypothetical protein
MKKAVLVALMVVAPWLAASVFPVNAFGQQSNIQLDPAEYNAYNNAAASGRSKW